MNQQKNCIARAAIVLALVVAMAGCETCQRHPAVCAAVTIVAAGSLAASLNHHDSQHAHDLRINDPRVPACTVQPNGSCR